MDEIWKKFLPLISLITGVVILGFSAIFVKAAQAPSVIVNLYRMGIAAVLLSGPFFYRSRRRAKPLPIKGVVLASLGGILFSLDLILWSAGVQISGPTNPTLMANTAPLWVGLGAALLFQEKRPMLFWIGLGTALLGAFLLLGLDFQQSIITGRGTLYGLAGGFFYGSYLLLVQQGRKFLDVLEFFWIAVISAVVLLVLVMILQGTKLTGYSRATYLNLLALGVLVQTIGWFVINYAQGYLPAAVVSPTLLGQPVITAVLSYLLLGEAFTWLQAFYGAVVLLGVLLVHRSSHHLRQKGVD